MSGPYFQKANWPPFACGGQIYSLDHLVEFEFDIIDSAKTLRRIAVTFSDHVFTRKVVPGDDAAWLYPHSSRRPGAFCSIHYRYSLTLPDLIQAGAVGDAWLLDGDERYAQIPTVDDDGRIELYSIVFSLDRVKGLPIGLHMRIRSAYPCDQGIPTTYGCVAFPHLVRLRAGGGTVKKRFDRNRRKPRAISPRASV